MTGIMKQVVPITFTQGIDQKTDKKLGVPGKLLTLENGIFQKNGRIQKRPARSALPGGIIDSADAADEASALATFDNELLQYSRQKVYSYSPSFGWSARGSFVPTKVSTDWVRTNSTDATICDSARGGNITVYAYNYLSSIYATVRDEVTGAIILEDYLIGAGTAPRVVYLAQYDSFYVFYSWNMGSGPEVMGRRYVPGSDPTSFGADVSIASNMQSNRLYDVVPDGYQLVFGYAHSDTQVGIGLLNSDLSAVGFTVLTGKAIDGIAVIKGPSTTYHLAFSSVAEGLKSYIVDGSMSSLYGPLTIDAHTTSAIYCITGKVKRDLSGVTFFYEISAAESIDYYVKKNVVQAAGTVGVASEVLRSVGLACKAFSYYGADDSNDHMFFGAVHSSTLQSTYFVVRDDGLIVAKQQAGAAGGLLVEPGETGYFHILPNVSIIDNRTVTYSFLAKVRLQIDPSLLTPNLVATHGIAKTEVIFDHDDKFSTAQLGKNLHIASGIVSMYDGRSVCEHGFNLYPEGLSVSFGAGTVLEADKTYQWIALYEWTDRWGQLHRSAPSLPVSGTPTGANRAPTVTVPNLRLTSKNEVYIVLYRTEGDGEVFYRTGSQGNPTSTDTSALSDSRSDALLIYNEILYTTGGVVEHLAPPSASHVSVYKGRLFLSGTETGEVFYSKLRANDREPAAFNRDEFFLAIGSEAGRSVATQVLDDKLIIFKTEKIYGTFGEGPDNTGAGSYPEPEFLTSTDFGCSNARSIVKLPGGIMFHSSKGIQLLNSQLSAQYIGAPVEDFNSLTITSAVLCSDNNQVRFTTSNGACLVYDYYFGQWSTFTSYACRHALMWGRDYCTITSDGSVTREDAALFNEGYYYGLKLVTGWLTFDSVVGFQRIFKFLLLGEWKSAHSLTVKVGYDFEETYRDTYILSASTVLLPYEFEAGLDYQKCKAVRFSIEDTPDVSSLGESFNISTLGILMGLKGKLTRQSAATKVAST